MARIASVVFAYYPADPRPRREAEALIRAGMSVDVICLRGEGEESVETVDGVRVFRLPVLRSRRGRFWYLWEYGWFILLSFFKLSMHHARRPYQIVHVHNMPDILVLCALVPRLSGSKVILDLHDPMPEIYMTKYSIGASHPVAWFLRLAERWSIRFADLVVTPNLAFRETFVSRGCPESKIHIVMNSPVERVFHQNVAPLFPEEKGQLVMMYHGLIAERNGLDTALEAIAIAREKIHNIAFHVFGDGDWVEKFLEGVQRLHLAETVTYHGLVSQETIARAIMSIHVGVIPNKMSPFTNLNLPTRIFEYLAMGKPVIAPRTKGILDYFNDGSLHFFVPGDPKSLAHEMIAMYENPKQGQEILRKGISVYDTYRWGVQERRFVELVRKLAGVEG